MKERCIFCDSKMDYNTKIELKGFKIIIHRLDHCKKCNFQAQSSMEIPKDSIESIKSILEDIVDYIKDHIFTIILSIIIVILTIIIIFFYIPSINVLELKNISNIILTIIIQSNLSLIGLILVSITLAWNRAQNDLAKLEKIRNSALDIICGFDANPDENTYIEHSIKEFYNYCKDSERKMPLIQPENTFILLGKLLATINYYRPSLCKRNTCYLMIEDFIKEKFKWRRPLYNDYTFFKCIHDLSPILSNHPNIFTMKKICDDYLILNRDNKIDFKLRVILFYNNLTGLLFKCFLLALFINTILSLFLLLSPIFSYYIFDIIIVLFGLTLFMIFKIILNIIEII